MIGQFIKFAVLTAALFGVVSSDAAVTSHVRADDGLEPTYEDAELMKILAAGGAQTVNKCVHDHHIHLTYDDGPGALTNNLLDDLASKGVKASFYVNAVNFNSYGAFTKRAFDEGHVVASHTWSHIDLSKADENTVMEQMLRNHNAVFKMTGKHMALMRPPYGATKDSQRATLKDLDYTIVLWNIDTNDWRKENKREGAAAAYVKTKVRNSRKPMIVLQHDIHQWSALSALQMITNIRDAGYNLVDIETCLGIPAYHGDDFVPKHKYTPDTRETCTAEGMDGICMTKKDCDHFEVGARFAKKCSGARNIQCCTGGCYSMCEKRWGKKGMAHAQCKQSCIAAKAGLMDCESEGGAGASFCGCKQDRAGSNDETACRGGYAFGLAGSKQYKDTGCQRLCSSTMYWENDTTGCVSACLNAQNSGMSCSNCTDDTCEVGCQFGNSLM